jgi:hypothetical protein
MILTAISVYRTLAHFAVLIWPDFPQNQLLAANNFQIVPHPAQRTHSPSDLTAFWRVYL